MFQKQFADRVVQVLKDDKDVLGLAIGGSWINDQMDEYSDLDFILVTRYKVAGDVDKMIAFAKRFGDFISGFTGEHVGEPRLLICLFDNPLIHVDIKFLTPDELNDRVEDPVILFERNETISNVLKNSKANWPQPDFQWIEDRFWTWVHYACMKIGRGELMEAFDLLSFLRMIVLSPLMQIKNNKPARGVRKVETELSLPDLENLKITIAQYNRESVLKALGNVISVYKSLRRKLYSENISVNTLAEKKVMQYFKDLKKS